MIKAIIGFGILICLFGGGLLGWVILGWPGIVLPIAIPSIIFGAYSLGDATINP